VWVRARLCKLQKGSTRLAAASDKAYQLLAHGRWFSPGTPAPSTTKTGRHEIAEILLKVALNTKNQSIFELRLLVTSLVSSNFPLTIAVFCDSFVYMDPCNITIRFSISEYKKTGDLDIVDKIKLRGLLGERHQYRQHMFMIWPINFKLKFDSEEDFARK
jgi:hypothetical protein